MEVGRQVSNNFHKLRQSLEEEFRIIYKNIQDQLHNIDFSVSDVYLIGQIWTNVCVLQYKTLLSLNNK